MKARNGSNVPQGLRERGPEQRCGRGKGGTLTGRNTGTPTSERKLHENVEAEAPPGLKKNDGSSLRSTF